jgi:UDP-N-acetylglucosamine 4,6-dehydratase
MDYFKDKDILITGGTGSFGSAFLQAILAKASPNRVVVLSRDELKQYELAEKLGQDPRVRFFLGDVREYERLYRAFEGIDIVVHAAALKQVPATEYNPFEAVKTNVLGAQHIIDAAIDQKVKRVIALSTDKASSPINLYGATKLVSDKLFIRGNAYSGKQDTRFSVVRYGNVVGSRGSIVPTFRRLAKEGKPLPITDERMTRFWITLDQAVDFVAHRLEDMQGGELFVPKIPSMRVVDLAAAIAPGASFQVIGIRPGEKLHEEMISADIARNTRDMGGYYICEPEGSPWYKSNKHGTPCPDGFSYSSDTNSDWLTVEMLRGIVSDG